MSFFQDEKKPLDFDALKLTLASPEQILNWSHGEVTKPETINYRTQKPEKDGLFCERIFGPSKDWECYCGKYKKIRYKGIVCDKCGVEVTRALVRRERMGHITLATPATHIWFLRGVPSKIGLLLDLSLQSLEKVIYFADFIITKVNEDLKKDTLEQIRQEFIAKKKKIENEFNQKLGAAKQRIHQQNAGKKTADELALEIENASIPILNLKNEQLSELEGIMQLAEQELKDLKPLTIISEHKFQDLSLKYGHIFEAGIGAEAIRKLLEEIDLQKLQKELNAKLRSVKTPAKDKIIKRLRLVSNLIKNKIKPEWTVLTSLPVIPPDLRPMVPLDGGRFATSDLNDLYRRIINRNNRLKQLVDLNAPEVICRNEKRMLQEAVDALIDNSARHGKTVTASTGQKRMLKSLADILRGKQGRFRQNLLGKRIDYSGRSVIVVGPKLKMHQCGLPKKMALELFKPFIISRLIKEETVHNVRSASKFIETGHARVWDILEEITKDAVVLLNRAPTLHRLGIQAFRPVLIEGKAIQVHPLVCPAFNADFDGDQMAVHVPLTEEAKTEAKNIMLASKNLLKPATGSPIANPGKDMVWGCYYLTMLNPAPKNPKSFNNPDEAILAWQYKTLKLQDIIKIKADSLKRKITPKTTDRLIETSVGRIIFNQILPPSFSYLNQIIDNSALKDIVSQLLDELGADKSSEILDSIKELGFKHITLSGYSWGMDDIPKIPERETLIAAGEAEVRQTENQYDEGLLTESERHAKIIEIWMRIKDQIVKISRQALDPSGPIYSMVESGARGSWSQLIQIMGMKGLVTNPAGEIIELPVKGNFKEGFDVLEYFISTHGARKGLSDTALRTANAGYLTRRLVDVAQDLVINTADCGDTDGIILTKKESEEIGLNLADRIINRFSLANITDPKTKKVIVKKNALITKEIAEKIKKLDLSEIKVRSVMNCKAEKGICQKCYGYDLGYNKLVELGTATGIIAAQSIGEPGTQLTMRTFHTGGVAGLDITQGLPRVEEIFEARPPKFRALMAEISGLVKIETEPNTRQKIIKIQSLSNDSKSKDKKNSDELKVVEYKVPPEYYILVKDGDLVNPGDVLTDGSLDLKQLYRYKGIEACQHYVSSEIQKIYSSQGQRLNDKHIELIARQMFSRVYVRDAGDTELMAGSRVEWPKFNAVNQKAIAAKKKPAAGDRLLLGITKVSLSTSSFLSAASFQETSRVLINAAIEGRIDHLEGLKENVIIGRLIPAGTGFKKTDAKK